MNKFFFQTRHENIRLKNQLKKRELQLKAKEELAEGLQMIDFEQLKIENQTYSEKIEERNEVNFFFDLIIFISFPFLKGVTKAS